MIRITDAAFIISKTTSNILVIELKAGNQNGLHDINHDLRYQRSSPTVFTRYRFAA